MSRPGPSPSPQPQPTAAAAHSRLWSTPPPHLQSQGTHTSSSRHHAYTHPPSATSPYQSYNQHAYGGAGGAWASSPPPHQHVFQVPLTLSATMGPELELTSPGIVAAGQDVAPPRLQTHPTPPLPPSSWSDASPLMWTPWLARSTYVVNAGFWSLTNS
ncbi:hypothetical protein BDN72DRAFT_962818 [Pluteus cervinus]|uniref:Uncharacterized protein n=1 Tax=Pluteus cervinus TaxID=181527 RepID=A0ACD3AHP6_9AGAR|nr:hypothetical protein BDN72DRAFT_962818 [Pluteus cervinus]